ncbi:MAG: D-aminopeptidase, partial [Thermomicrobiales bacterium]|nr:D-aminopeptidase [Thermomicrobiales bacterium]
VATDAPLLDRGLRRVSRRAGIGLARTGSMGGHGSGDVVIAFSTSPTVRIPHAAGELTLKVEFAAEGGPAGAGSAIDALFAATVEATEEAIVNALLRATTVVGRDGNVSHALPLEPLRQMLLVAGRIGEG